VGGGERVGGGGGPADAVGILDLFSVCG